MSGVLASALSTTSSSSASIPSLSLSPHQLGSHRMLSATHRSAETASDPPAPGPTGEGGEGAALARSASRGSRLGRPSHAALTAALAEAPPVARLLLLTPRSEGLKGIIPEEISLARPRLLVGRPSHSVSVDVPLSVLSGGSDIISRRHAELQRTLDGKHIIRDAGALNGMRIYVHT